MNNVPTSERIRKFAIYIIFLTRKTKNKHKTLESDLVFECQLRPILSNISNKRKNIDLEYVRKNFLYKKTCL